MPVKKEVCRNFARGSCHFGQRCRFLHVNPQQQQPQQQQQQQRPQNNNNAYFSQSQHQKPNPYGFGVQSNSQRNTQPKPFENTWTRFSPVPASTAQPSSNLRQAENHSQTTNHTCTDPESCRRIIVDDFQHERPLWKLTCYGHWKNAPCDIAGDISYEELRTAAYDDAKRGLSLPTIVERERKLLSSKLIEFENLCKPGVVLSNSQVSNQNTSLGAGPNAFSQAAQTNSPTLVSSFNQLGTSLDLGVGSRPPAPSNNAFSQPNSFGSFGSTSNAFGSFGQTSNAFGTRNLSSESQGHTVGNPFGSGSTAFGNTTFGKAASNSVSTSPLSTQIPAATNNPSFGFLNSNLNGSSSTGEPPQLHDVGKDSAWFKERWNPGEVPEEAPPDSVCY